MKKFSNAPAQISPEWYFSGSLMCTFNIYEQEKFHAEFSINVFITSVPECILGTQTRQADVHCNCVQTEIMHKVYSQLYRNFSRLTKCQKLRVRDVRCPRLLCIQW